MKMKLLLLTMGSLLLTAVVIASAFYQKRQFYPSVIYLTKSSISMAALYLQAFVLVIIISKILGRIFFGQLRPTEVEHLIERMWYAITETCLAFTVFRDDFSSRFVAMFTILLFFKCFHWLAEDRVDFMERSPVIPLKFHIRIIGLVTFLSIVDYMFIMYAYHMTVEKGPSAQLVFGFEYTILKLSLLVILFRYILHTIDSRRETPWDQKATFMLYIDLISNFLKLTLYLMFLFLMIRVHTLPLFIIRPVYLSLRSFKKSVQDLILSRRAIHYMNTVFTNATQEELTSGDNICIICREEMVASESNARDHQGNVPKCLPCSHIFHCACLRTWFQRQQTCPTCRMDILRNATNPRVPVTSEVNRQNQASSSAPSTAPVSASAPNLQPTAPPTFMPPFPPTPFPWMMPQPQSNDQQNSTNTSSTGNVPTGFPPFGAFMFPVMPMFSRPMPELSSEDLAKMSEDDLIKLEKDGREGIEFRIQTIQRIQTLLDAAVLQMNAYMISVRNMTNIDNKVSVSVNTSEKIKKEFERGDEKIIKTENFDNLANKEDISVTTENCVAKEELETDVAGNSDENLVTLRDRRLKKFLSQTSNEEVNEA